MQVNPANKTKCTTLSKLGISKRPPDGMVDPGRHSNTCTITVHAMAGKTELNSLLITQ